MSAENPVMVPIDPPEPVEVIDEPTITDPVEDPSGSVSDNETVSGNDTGSSENKEEKTEEKVEKKDEEDNISGKPNIITVETHTLDSISVNAVVDPDDIVSVNSVSLNVISADGLSLNSVSLNISENYVSNNYVTIVSQDSTSIWDKPFDQYTTSEGLLFTIMVTLVLGFVSSHLLKGLRRYGNI